MTASQQTEKRPRHIGVVMVGKPGVQQQFESECNVNNIMARYRQTGTVKQSTVKAFYGDFRNVGDYQSAQNSIFQAGEAFMNLSSKIRSRFENNPAKLLAFLDNPQNRQEAIALGIITSPSQSSQAAADGALKAPAAAAGQTSPATSPAGAQTSPATSPAPK